MITIDHLKARLADVGDVEVAMDDATQAIAISLHRHGVDPVAYRGIAAHADHSAVRWALDGVCVADGAIEVTGDGDGATLRCPMRLLPGVVVTAAEPGAALHHHRSRRPRHEG